MAVETEGATLPRVPDGGRRWLRGGRSQGLLLGVAGLVLCLVVFELAVRSGVLDGSVIPPIADIFGALGGLVQSADADADALVSTVTGNQLASR